MQKPMDAKMWTEMPKRAAEWFKNVEENKIENPFALKPVTPYRPKPAEK